MKIPDALIVVGGAVALVLAAPWFFFLLLRSIQLSQQIICGTKC